METRNKSKKSYSETAKSGNVSSSSDFSSSSTQSNAGSFGQQETMICHSTSQQCPVGNQSLGQQSSGFESSQMSQQGSMVCSPSHKCPVIGSSSTQMGEQGSIGSSAAQMSSQQSSEASRLSASAPGHFKQQNIGQGFGASSQQGSWSSSGWSHGASGQMQQDIGSQQMSSGRTHSETRIKGVTDINTSMSSVPVPSNVQLHSTEFKAQSLERNQALQQQPLISKPIVPEQHYVHTVAAQPQVVEVMPAQKVETIEKTVNISDHGLQNKMQHSAQSLNEYMNCLQNEANLLAMEKANKQVLEQTRESIVDTSRQRHELEKTASLCEAETIHKLKEAEAAAKQMMADAKMQVKHVEELQKRGGVAERITEKNKKLDIRKREPTVIENPMEDIDKFIDEEGEKSPNVHTVNKINERTQTDSSDENNSQNDATQTETLDQHSETEMDETDHYGHYHQDSWLTETKNLLLYLFDVVVN